MTALALILSVCAAAGFTRAALSGSAPALAVGVVDAVAGGLCWFASWVSP